MTNELTDKKRRTEQSQEQGFNWTSNNNDAEDSQANSLWWSKILIGQGQIADSVTETNHGWGVKSSLLKGNKHRENFEIISLSTFSE